MGAKKERGRNPMRTLPTLSQELKKKRKKNTGNRGCKRISFTKMAKPLSLMIRLSLFVTVTVGGLGKQVSQVCREKTIKGVSH